MRTDHIFIGRHNELAELEELKSRRRAGLVVIKGCRRVGKSRLVREFAKKQRFLEFTGLPPAQNTTAQDQRDMFAYQMAQLLHLPPHTFKDWSDAFNSLTHYLTNEPTVILLDEISWMGSMDSTF